MNYSISDFIPFYPDQRSDDIQWDITAKKEFNELVSYPQPKDITLMTKRKGKKSVPSSENGKCFDDKNFFDHQRVVLRLIQHYNRLLLIHETGTGKSCAFIGPSEFSRKCLYPAYKRAFILEHNETNCEEFIKQVQENCAVGAFATKRDALRWYRPMTYTKFINHEMSIRNAEGEYELLSDYELINKFSGCLFFIDEAHNLRGSDETDSKKEGDISNFQKLKMLFNIIKRYKLIIATATPMFNSPEEIIKIAELLSGGDIAVEKNFDWETGDLSFLQSHIRGKVSYVRSADTGILLQPQGRKIPLPNEGIYQGQLSELKRDPITTVVPLEIRGWQYQTVKEVYQKGLTGERGDQPFSNEETNSFSFVFPLSMENKKVDEDTEKALYRRFVKSESIGGKMKYFFSDEKAFKVTGMNKLISMREFITDFNRLKEVSIKIAFILKCELRYALNRGAINPKNYLERFNIDFTKKDFEYEYDEGDRGTSFVYTTQLSTYGAKLIAAVFEVYGFEMYSRSGNILDQEGIPIIPKKLRFGLHIGEATNVASLLSLFNSDANYHGEYVQCYIGSKIARDAISLFNATRMYKYIPDWHESGNHQADSRILRATSHVLLTKEKGERVIVKTYNLAAYLPLIPEKKITLSLNNSDFTENSFSTDVKLYLIAEIKDFRIRRVMKYLKINAVDCMINYPRNVRLSDVEGEKECDFGECFYRCENGKNLSPEEIKTNLRKELEDHSPQFGLAGGQGPTMEEYDFSTYDILYSEDIIASLEKKILSLVIKRGILSFSDLILFFTEKYSIEGYTLKNIERYIFDACERRISSKIPFLDSYGYKCYLQSDGTHIFIQRDFPRRADVVFSNTEGEELYGRIGYYSTQLIGLRENSLSSVIDKVKLRENPDLSIEENEISLEKKHPFSSEGLSLLSEEGLINHIFGDKYTDKDRIALFEDVLSHPEEYSQSVKTTLSEYYSYYFLEFKEPTKAILEIRTQINTVKQGNQSKNLKDRNVDFSKLDLTRSGENVYIHVLSRDADSKDYEKTIFYRASQTQEKMRILIPSQSKEWRGLNDMEYKLYPRLFEENHLSRIEGYTRKKFYGIIYYSSKNEEVFAIAANETKKDKREEMRGGRCTTKSLSDIIAFLLNEGMTPFTLPNRDFDELIRPTQREMREYLSSRNFTFSEKNLEEVYTSSILNENKIRFTSSTYSQAFDWWLYFTRKPRSGESKHKASLKNRISEMCDVFYTIYSKQDRIVRYPYI